MNTDDRTDPERDAWLRAALRHAPDADAAPPASLSETILRQARAAARAGTPQRAAGPATAWATVRTWLARPPLAAGFASVMVATLVGVTWWGRPMQDALPRPTVETAPAPEPASAPAAAAAPVDPARRSAPARPPALERRSAAPARGPAPEPAPRAFPPASPAPESVEPTRPMPAASVTAAPREAAAPAAAAARLRSSTAARSNATGAAASGPAEAWQASIAEQPERWGWERGGAVQPMRPALQRWLAEADLVPAPAAQRNESAADAAQGTVLRLYRDGVLVTTLRVDDGTRRRALDDATR